MTDAESPTETIAELRNSFFYGSRKNLNYKFVNDLTDAEFGDFLEEYFQAAAAIIDTGDPSALSEVHYRWQVKAYRGHLGDPADFAHRHEDTPWAPMAKPLSEAKIALMTSSGHFVDGDDPKPLGVEDMNQDEAEDRIMETIKEAPSLSMIPSGTPFEQIRVRHGGYPVEGAAADPQVVLPLRIMEALDSEGIIGGFADVSYSFVGAAAQGPIKKRIGPEWAEMLREAEIDAVLLVPI